MKRSDWFLFVLLPLAITWLLDRVSKLMALNLEGLTFYGPIGITLHYNPGAILGLFADLPPVLRIVSLSTGGAFLVFMFIIIQILLPIRAPMLRAGMAILLGGILGNVADRIYWGKIVDFVLISFGGTYSPVFNIADALQWVGYALVVISLLREGNKIWPEDNLRKSYLINTSYQLRYCAKLVAFGVAFALISGIFSYTFLRVALEDYGGNADISKILTPFLLTYIVLSLVFIIILFFTGLVLSHRAAGPVYAFQRFLEELLAGKKTSLTLRTDDEFPNLEHMAKRVSEKFGPEKKD